MSDLKSDDGKQAVYCLEHLLYEIPFSSLHNTAALLAQELKRPVHEFGTSTGHWTWETVERFLRDRGYGCTVAGHSGCWHLDISPTFLRKSPGFVGFITPFTLESYKWVNGYWTRSKGERIELECMHAQLEEGSVAVHQMWASVMPFYENNKPFFVMSEEPTRTEHEHRPSSCWNPEPISMEGRSKAVKAYMKENRRKRGGIMMSNESEMVLCRPTRNGWKTKTILEYECMPIRDVGETVTNILADKVAARIEQNPALWPVLAHAMHSCLRFMGGRITIDECSDLTAEERDILQQYEQGLSELDI